MTKRVQVSPGVGLTTSSESASGATRGNSTSAGDEQAAVPPAGDEQAAVPPAGDEQAAVPPAGDEQAAVPPAGDEQAAVWDWKRGLADISMAVTKGVLQPTTLQTIANLAFQEQLQSAEIRHKDTELALQKAASEASEARSQAEMQAEIRHKDTELALQKAAFEAGEARSQAEMQADRAKWEAEVGAETTADMIRSIVLFLVVLAVVATPIFAMVRHIPPTAFLQYVAPITAIAGTVLGYWFGRQDQGLKRRVRPKG